MKPGAKGQDNMKKIKNILSDITSKDDNKDFDLLFLVDATASMGSYIISAKEETKNISKELRKLYPDRNFKYGYIFYRDPIDSHSDIHEVIDLTDDANSIPDKIAKIDAKGGGDFPEDWAGAYKLVNEKISWRDGEKVIIHLADAGAHGKLFTLSDKYPDEEGKLIQELEKCALKKINIFGYIIEDDAKNTFTECAKFYRSKGGFFEVSDFCPPEMKNMMNMNSMMNAPPPMMNNMNMMNMNSMMNAPGPMMNNMNMMSNSAPMQMQMMNNMNFRQNSMNSVSMILNRK